jgi:hypothetical protein
MPFIDNFIPNRDQTGGDVYSGGVEGEFRNYNLDPYMKRPFLDERERPCLLVNQGRWTTEKGQRVPIRQRALVRDLLNRGIITPETLMDNAVLLSARQRLRAWADLSAANSFGGFDGMSRSTLEYEVMSDPGEAVVDMDGITDGRTDSPLFRLRSLPLPITHSDYWFSERRIRISRNSTPIDTTMAECAGRRVAEMIEKTTIGLTGGFSGFSYGAQTSGYAAHDTAAPADGHGSAMGASSVYGYTTFPHRLTKTNFTTPTTTNGPTTYAEVLVALNQLFAQRFYGPFMLYHSIDWSPYMDSPFSTSGGNHPSETLRTMLMKIPDISGVRRLDFLDSTYTLVFVQMTGDVARAINGMGITTVQWPSQGGMRQNFKVMCIMVPQLRSDYSGRTGILHGTVS